MLVTIDVRQDKIDVLLAALKAAEGVYTTSGFWQPADEVGKLHASLRKQIFSYEVEQ